jgi:iron complex transport system ATP-binding protein
MVQRPDMLMLDEPTANLDLGWREHIVALIGELFASAGITILLVCHEPEVLPACCRRVVFLEAGRVTADGPPEQVLTSDRVRRLYGPTLTMRHQGGRHAVVPGRAGDEND